MTSTPPDSGDGLPPPDPGTLPHPALWSDPPAGRPPAPFLGTTERDEALPTRTRGRVVAVYATVAVMAVAAALLGLAVVLRSLPLGVVGLVLGGTALLLALRARILSMVSVGQSFTGPG